MYEFPLRCKGKTPFNSPRVTLRVHLSRAVAPIIASVRNAGKGIELVRKQGESLVYHVVSRKG